jgi:hypothetical protein
MKRILSLALAVTALAATAAHAKPGDGWDGVWEKQGSNMFDQSRGALNANFAREYPPYNAEWEAKYVAVLKAATEGKPTDPTANCVPGGMPRIMINPYPQELVVKDNEVLVLKELQTQIRRIYVDGRKPPADMIATYTGYSTGHWEGDTLVADTIGLRGDTVFDRTAAPHSNKITVHERMRLRTPDIWEDQITVTDPIAFTKPWTVMITYKRQPTWEILEYVCEENNRNGIDKNGATIFDKTAAK